MESNNNIKLPEYIKSIGIVHNDKIVEIINDSYDIDNRVEDYKEEE